MYLFEYLFQQKNENDIIEIIKNDKDININENDIFGDNLLSFSIKYNYLNLLKYLLEQPNINVNIVDKTRNTPLNNSIIYNSINSVKLLLQHPDIDVNGSLKNNDIIEDTPLMLTISRHNTEIAKLLLSHKDIIVNKDNNVYKNISPLCKSIHYKNKQVSQLIINHHNFDINSLDEEGDTALYNAITLHEDDVCYMLLNHPNIDLLSKTSLGYSFIELCILFSNSKILYELINKFSYIGNINKYIEFCDKMINDYVSLYESFEINTHINTLKKMYFMKNYLISKKETQIPLNPSFYDEEECNILYGKSII